MATTMRGKGPVNPVDGLEQAADEYLIGGPDSDFFYAPPVESIGDLKLAGQVRIEQIQQQRIPLKGIHEFLKSIGNKLDVVKEHSSNIPGISAINQALGAKGLGFYTTTIDAQDRLFTQQRNVSSLLKSVDQVHDEKEHLEYEDPLRGAEARLSDIQKTLQNIAKLKTSTQLSVEEIAQAQTYADYLKETVIPLFKDKPAQVSFKTESPVQELLQYNANMATRHAKQGYDVTQKIAERVIAEREANDQKGLETAEKLDPNYAKRIKEKRAEQADEKGAYI